MAVVRSRSTPPYATIIFVFLWVISTGIAIWLGVQKGDAEKRADNNRQQALASEKRAADANIAAGNLRKVIEESNGKTSDEVASDAITASQKAGYSNQSLLAILADQSNQLNSKNQLVTQLQAQNTELNDQMKNGIQTNSASLAAANQSLNQEKTNAAKAEAEASQERADKVALLAQKEADLTKFKDTSEQTRRENILTIQALKTDNASKDAQIVQLHQDLAAKRTGLGNLAIQSAGTIVRAHAGADECYISLGRADRITQGMPFSVHDPRIGVKLQSETDINAKPDPTDGGKGSLEVIEVGEHQSLCRITNLKKDQHIEEGDLIANLFYTQDRNKKFHFVVFGDFDLDGDGVATAAEHDRLVRMITSWGGVVDEQLSPQTDYLVLGDRPSTSSSTGAVEPGGIADERAHQQKQYDDLFSEAKRSSVPILNANRFLSFIGYYNNTVVH